MDQKSPLATYIQRVLALKEERAAALSEEELREVALEIGLTETDLAAVEAAAADHQLRGQGFLEHRRWDDAIRELEEAVAVSPNQVDRLHALAGAYSGRWQEGRDPDDRSRAELVARQCLELDPRHEASIEVLNDLDRSPAVTSTSHPDPSSHRAPSKKRLPLLTASALLFVGLIMWRTLPSGDQVPRPVPLPETESFSPPAASETTAESKELDIPVALEPGASGAVLDLDIRQSRLVRYASGGSFYTLNAIVTNRGTTELDKISVRLEVQDAAGTIRQQEPFELLTKASPVLRPADAMPLHRLREIPTDARQARLVDRKNRSESSPGFLRSR